MPHCAKGIPECENGRFHEGLTLIQRDRNAAWFAEEDGGQSSFVRDRKRGPFSFAHLSFCLTFLFRRNFWNNASADWTGSGGHRIGACAICRRQRREVLVRWYREANGFETNLRVDANCWNDLEPPRTRRQLPRNGAAYARDWSTLRNGTARDEVAKRLHDGRDRLLEQFYR
jgi:ATP-dependent helicase HepA